MQRRALHALLQHFIAVCGRACTTGWGQQRCKGNTRAQRSPSATAWRRCKVHLPAAAQRRRAGRCAACTTGARAAAAALPPAAALWSCMEPSMRAECDQTARLMSSTALVNANAQLRGSRKNSAEQTGVNAHQVQRMLEEEIFAPTHAAPARPRSRGDAGGAAHSGALWRAADPRTARAAGPLQARSKALFVDWRSNHPAFILPLGMRWRRPRACAPMQTQTARSPEFDHASDVHCTALGNHLRRQAAPPHASPPAGLEPLSNSRRPAGLCGRRTARCLQRGELTSPVLVSWRAA